MKDDIDSVRGLLDRLKEEKERELLKEVNCSNADVSICWLTDWESARIAMFGNSASVV